MSENEINTYSIVDRIIIKRKKELDSDFLCEIKSIAIENGIQTEILLNEKAIISALEKQIPKKPVIPFDSIFQQYECPKCPHKVYKTQQYCDKCGQALDWSEEE